MVLADVERALQTLAGQPQRRGPAPHRGGRTGAVRPARPGRHREGEHGPRPGLAAARLRPRAGACAAGAEPAAGDARRVVRARRRPGRAGGDADQLGVDRHVPPALPGTFRGAGGARAARGRRVQPTVGGLPAAPDADRPARHPQHLADGPSAPAAGPAASRRCGWPTRSPSARCCLRRTAPVPTHRPGARRSRSSAPTCTPRCGTCRGRSATTTTSGRPRSSRCRASRPCGTGCDPLPHRARHALRLRRRRDRQLRPVPPDPARPGLAAGARARGHDRAGPDHAALAHRPLREHQVVVPRHAGAHRARRARRQHGRRRRARAAAGGAGGALGGRPARGPHRPAGRLGGDRLHVRVALRRRAGRRSRTTPGCRSRRAARSARPRPS